MKSLSVAAILLLCVGAMAEAKTVDVTGENFTVDIPETWTVVPPPDNADGKASALVFSATDKISGIQILVGNNPNGLQPADPAVVANLKEAVSKTVSAHGAEANFTSENQTTLDGIPAYLVQYTVAPSGSQSIIARVYQICANGKRYIIALQSSDSSQDAELAEIANSLHFASPPELPTPQFSHRKLKIALLAGAVIGGLIVVVVAILIFRRKREAGDEE